MAFNPETKSFVIIEYKRGHSYSVIDQAMTYLALLLNHKAEFTQQLSEYKNIVITKKDIDWSQSRIIIVAESFNTYQKESIHFKDLPLELFECKRFQGDCIVINPVISHYATESIKQITTLQTDEFEIITKELKTYTEEEHMQVCDAPIVKIYEEIKEFILDLDDEIVFEPKKMYISCRKNRAIYFDLKLGKSYIKIFFNIKQ